MYNSMSGKVVDPYPHYRPAGIGSSSKNESAMHCIRPSESGGRPPTPPEIQKYRRSHMQAVGKTIIHPGKVGDELPKPDFAFGVVDKGSMHVPDCISGQDTGGFKSKLNEFKEEIYLSRKKEPLGRKMERNYVFPEATQVPEFKFGIKTVGSDNTSKDLMQTGFVIEETPKTETMYKKSHGFSKPGEQVRRDYEWPFNPNDHRFGKVENRELNQAKKCLQPEAAAGFPKTDLVQQNLDEYRNFHHDHLGKVKNLGQTGSLHDPNLVFGKNPKKQDIWNVAQCIRGDATFSDAYNDDCLGRATRYGFKNLPKKGDEQRVFGVPSIRFDVSKPANPSVANMVNYGTDPAVVELMFPHCYTHYGLSADDIVKPREKEEVNLV